MKKTFLIITAIALTASQVFAESSISKDELSRLLEQSLPVLRTVVVGDTWTEEITVTTDEEGCSEKGIKTSQIIKKNNFGYHTLIKTRSLFENCPRMPEEREYVEYSPNFTSEELTAVLMFTSAKELGNRRYSLTFEENVKLVIDLNVPAYRTVISGSFYDSTNTSTYNGIRAISIPDDEIELCMWVPMDNLTRVQVCEKGYYPWLWEKN
jgi:hypothetical protein